MDCGCQAPSQTHGFAVLTGVQRRNYASPKVLTQSKGKIRENKWLNQGNIAETQEETGQI